MSLMYRSLLVVSSALASALPPALAPLSKQAQEISYVTVAVVNLEYQGAILPVEVKT